MVEGDDSLELKFRIFYGTDIGHGTYSSSITTTTLKQRLLSEWPQEKSVVPKSVSDMKLMHAGKVLENGKTLAESRVQVVTFLVELLPCMWWYNLLLLNERQTRTRQRSNIRAHVLTPSFRAHRSGAEEHLAGNGGKIRQVVIYFLFSFKNRGTDEFVLIDFRGELLHLVPAIPMFEKFRFNMP